MISASMETKQFNEYVNKVVKECDVSTDKALRKIAFDLLSNIIKPPPYGTHPV